MLCCAVTTAFPGSIFTTARFSIWLTYAPDAVVTKPPERNTPQHTPATLRIVRLRAIEVCRPFQLSNAATSSSADWKRLSGSTSKHFMMASANGFVACSYISPKFSYSGVLPVTNSKRIAPALYKSVRSSIRHEE